MTQEKHGEKAKGTPREVFQPQWVHFQIQDEELWNQMQKMVKAHQGGVSAFMRWLISREWARRTTGPLSLPNDVPVPDAEARQRNGAHWVGKKAEGNEGEGEK